MNAKKAARRMLAAAVARANEYLSSRESRKRRLRAMLATMSVRGAGEFAPDGLRFVEAHLEWARKFVARLGWHSTLHVGYVLDGRTNSERDRDEPVWIGTTI
jgi:hypothetical protein